MTDVDRDEWRETDEWVTSLPRDGGEPTAYTSDWDYEPPARGFPAARKYAARNRSLRESIIRLGGRVPAYEDQGPAATHAPPRHDPAPTDTPTPERASWAIPANHPTHADAQDAVDRVRDLAAYYYQRGHIDIAYDIRDALTGGNE